eukprot:jgi/Botrbrau1/4722/Bobra.0218s0037.2
MITFLGCKTDHCQSVTWGPNAQQIIEEVVFRVNRPSCLLNCFHHTMLLMLKVSTYLDDTCVCIVICDL